ncbi:MAG: hypothetical protein A3F11_01885 [Gammaproteobacteria bacterium RIFCSPHIGHO2_12_FULL_37_14]|nr:MAG: hypothetical protein A3F11_01885 [Gammaproteobacteria bacterium RIFCSPHIGHO2_12_FULL_37_14]
MKRLLIFLTLLFSTILHSAPIKTIRFATEATYPPFEYIDESGQMKGFDIDLANALCQQIQATCTFTNQAFNSLITSLNLGKFDAIISAMGITPERLKQVNFTTAYYVPKACFVTALDKHYTVADLLGKKIGVQQGATMERYVNEKYGDKVTIKTYASIQEGFLDLTSGRVDFILTDLPIAQAWLKKNNYDKQYEVMGKPIVDSVYFGAGYGIAIRQDNIELLNALNKALITIKTNGTYDKITKKYFGD